VYVEGTIITIIINIIINIINNIIININIKCSVKGTKSDLNMVLRLDEMPGKVSL